MSAKALPNFRIWLRHDDGVEEKSIFDLAGRGVFKVWNDTAFFDSVHSVSWSDRVG